MKRYIFSFLFVVLCLGVNNTFAQGKAKGPQQQDNPAVIHGHFTYDKVINSATRHVHVNYSLMPKPFATDMKVLLSTPHPVILSVDIANEGNQVVASWTPAQIDHVYQHDFNTSTLPAGNYHVNFRVDNNNTVLKTIPFTK